MDQILLLTRRVVLVFLIVSLNALKAEVVSSLQRENWHHFLNLLKRFVTTTRTLFNEELHLLDDSLLVR